MISNIIIDVTDPREILNKIKEIKRCENNLTSVDLRKQLYNIKYFPNKEKAIEFWDGFEEIVRNYNNIHTAPPLSDQEIRDAFYQAIEKSVEKVQEANFLNFNMTGKYLTYENLKRFIIQDEATNRNRNTQQRQTSNQGAQALAVNTGYEDKRCYQCDAMGHIGAHCPNEGKLCYQCKQFTNHIARDCPRGPPNYRRDNNGNR